MIRHSKACRLTYHNDIKCNMRCIEFLRLFFSEFQILKSEFRFLDYSTAEFEETKSEQNLWNQKRNRNSASNGGPRNWNRKSELPIWAISHPWTACYHIPVPLFATKSFCSSCPILLSKFLTHGEFALGHRWAFSFFYKKFVFSCNLPSSLFMCLY